MTDPTLVALIGLVGVNAAAIISGLFVLLRNRKLLDPTDPDKVLIGQVSVGWFMREFEKRMTSAVEEGMRRNGERK